ncbi:hypothetical protein CLV81_3104 [Flagellimonas meridianipacifica]|uniref:MG2 domain-containing protein n=2 Tax=Flagellimonas meridianipacifica TaxID=1080225 RepID=A0A2T0MB24_9FLAO|nr:hypothetical protein CLV81_3104 [Allomuricauda pacifica]
MGIASNSLAQLRLNEGGNAELAVKFISLPEENIFLHFNTNVLFTGERFFYSLYCLDREENNPSNLSQVAYVELISENGISIVKQKVQLDGGRGYGDFFISEKQLTGSYKLLAYTNWMKNFGVESFFETDVIIVNPYQEVPEKYRKLDKDSISDVVPNTNNTSKKTEPKSTPSKITLKLDNQVVGKRKKVALGIQTKDSSLVNGSYSLSISKRSELFPNDNKPVKEYLGNNGDTEDSIERQGFFFASNMTSNEIFYLPELRGELISGRVVNSNTDLPIPERTIALSIPGEDYLLKTATTNDQGLFFINVDEKYENSTAIIDNVTGDWSDSKLLLDDKKISYDKLDFMPFKLNIGMAETIRRRSVQNQIANAYAYLRLDNVLNPYVRTPFYREMERTFYLDDFTRFKTLRETFVEIINQVGIRRTPSGKRVFQVFTDLAREKSGLRPMLFVDGVFISEHESFMDYDARKIKEISFSKGLYRLGSISFDGILTVTTIDGDFAETFYSGNQLKIELNIPERNKDYFKQNYHKEDIQDWTHIPDFRRQLLWIPLMQLGKVEPIEFYTSNIEGVYDITLRGFTKTGELISSTTTLMVK